MVPLIEETLGLGKDKEEPQKYSPWPVSLPSPILKPVSSQGVTFPGTEATSKSQYNSLEDQTQAISLWYTGNVQTGGQGYGVACV